MLPSKGCWKENLRLRQLLGAKEESRILAAVIARPDELPYDFCRLTVVLIMGLKLVRRYLLGMMW